MHNSLLGKYILLLLTVQIVGELVGAFLLPIGKSVLITAAVCYS